MSYTRGWPDSTAFVGLVGLEPTTSTSQTSRATKLRHSPCGQVTSPRFLVPPPSYGCTTEVGMELEQRTASWESLSRWERSELGKDLRRTGLSYGEIMELIPVKKSTLATWCREVRLTEEQWEAIKARTGSQAGIPRDTNRKRRAEIVRIREQARARIPDLARNPFWIAGAVLYVHGAPMPGTRHRMDRRPCCSARRCRPRKVTSSPPGRWRNWQRNGLLTRRFWVRIPGDPLHSPLSGVRDRKPTTRVWRKWQTRQGLGPCDRKVVEVQLLSPAPGFFGVARRRREAACNHFATILSGHPFDPSVGLHGFRSG